MRHLLATLFLCATIAAPFVRAEDSAPPAKSSSGFYHPGVLVNRAQLDFIKAKVAAGAEPWKSAFEAAKSSEYGAISYTPHPIQTVECGPFSKPDHGCKDEQRDSAAAYTQALLWYITGDKTYAKTAIKIMTAGSTTQPGAHTNPTGPVRPAGAGENFPRPAEIIPYPNDGWSPADVEKFQK